MASGARRRRCARDRPRPSHPESAARKSAESTKRDSESMWSSRPRRSGGRRRNDAQLLAGAAAGLVVRKFVGHGGIAVRSAVDSSSMRGSRARGRSDRPGSRSACCARGVAGVLDVADDLDLVHAVAGAGGRDDIFLDHHAAHVVGAVGETELTDLAALRHPRGLDVVEVVEDDARQGEGSEVVDAGRFSARQPGMVGLIAQVMNAVKPPVSSCRSRSRSRCSRALGGGLDVASLSPSCAALRGGRGA